MTETMRPDRRVTSLTLGNAEERRRLSAMPFNVQDLVNTVRLFCEERDGLNHEFFLAAFRDQLDRIEIVLAAGLPQ